MPPEALQKLKEKLNAIDNAVTIEELKKAIEAMLAFSVKLQTKTETELVAIKTAVDGAISRIQTLSKEEADEAKQEIMDSCDGMMNEMRLTHEAMMAEATTKIDSLVQPKNGENGEDGKDGKDGKDGSPDTPEQVRDKLESIENEDDKLTIKAIGHLQEELDKLKLKLSEKNNVVGHSSIPVVVNGTYAGEIHDLILSGSAVSYTTDSSGRRVLVFTGGSGATAVEDKTSGTIDGSNLVFVFAHVPLYVIVDGISKFETIDYTLAGTTVTLLADNQPTRFIRSVYSA